MTNNRATGDAGSGGGILNATGGALTVSSAIVSNNTANRAGGGIEDASGSMSEVYIRNSKLNDNTVFTSPGNGGGFHVDGDGNSFVIGGEANGNTAGAEGGGLWNNSGTMTVLGVDLMNNVALGDDADKGGGALYNNGGTMLVSASEIIGNQATGTSGSGGGLFSTDGKVVVAGGSFTGNMSNRAGGAVEIISGVYESVDVDYMDNMTGSAPGNGGAFHVTGMDAEVYFTGGTVSGNSAANQGGGIWNQSGTVMVITAVSILDNMVTGNGMGVGGGGVYNNGGVLDIRLSTLAGNMATGGSMTAGGGVLNAPGGDIDILVSTLSGNATGGSGGGFFNAGKAFVEYSTIALNTAMQGGGYFQGVASADLTIVGTAISDNAADQFPDFGATAARVNSEGFNLISDDGANQFPARSTDREGMSGNFGPLMDNGGPTMTHVPMCPSPVIDHGNPFYQVADQRGEMVFGKRRDIGAVEKQKSCMDMARSPAMASASGAEVEEVQLSPNPTRDFALVRLPRMVNSGQATLTVLSAEGRVVTNRVTTATTERLEVGHYAPGTYTLRVVAGDDVQTVRLVVVR